MKVVASLEKAVNLDWYTKAVQCVYLGVQCVLHRDIKSSNIMLDAGFNPHLGGFELARVINHEKLETTTMMAGTFGYMAPEMHYTSKATKDPDVYSFGVLMLEVLCGRRPVNLQVENPDENFMLLQAVWQAYEAGNIMNAHQAGAAGRHSGGGFDYALAWGFQIIEGGS